MGHTKQEFFPGDRVRITEDVDEFEQERPDQTFILGTKGSLGLIVTPEEFWMDYVGRLRQAESVLSNSNENPVNIYESLLSSEHEKSFLAGVKSGMEANYRYPVKFETVEPSSDADAVICCRVGECQLIRVFRNFMGREGKILQKIW